MADEVHYDSHKRKYEEDLSPPRTRRSSGFSDGPAPPPSAAPPAPYGAVAPPVPVDFREALQKAQQLAKSALGDQAKRSKFDDNNSGPTYTPNLSNFSDQKPLSSNNQMGSIPPASASQGVKKIQIPNGRVGVIIGKAGETIKYLQNQSGARIQITRDADHDPSIPNRTVDLMGSQEQISRAEQLINEVLAEAETGGSGSGSRRQPGGAGAEQFVMKVPSNKVGLVIGKGGETIKNIQSTSGARVQVIPLHPPPGDMSMERTVQIDGTSDQIEIAKQMVNEVMENRSRNPAMSGGYSQQGYQARPPTNWAPQTAQVQQPGGYGYMQQPGGYHGAPSQYSQQPYSGYTQAASAGYTQNWDQSSAQSQQAPQGGGYDYYGQQASSQQQQQPPSGAPNDSSGYNYSQAPTPGAYSQGYSQDGYYHAAPGQPGYGQPPANPQSGYEQQHAYSSASGYGNVTNPQSQDGHPPSYGTQGESGQQPSTVQPQQAYAGQPSPNSAYQAHGTSQPGYGMPPTSQPGYGTPSAQGGYVAGYGTPQGQRTPPPNAPPPYGQPQQSPSQAGQPGYSSSQAPAAPTYGGSATQAAAYPPPYGAPPVAPPSYGQPPAYYGGGYSQPPVYAAADGNGTAAPDAAAPPAAQPSGAKTSP